MSFDNKKYPNRKDWRKPYMRGGKRFDRSCRCHGSCSYCYNNRYYSTIKRINSAKDKEKGNE